MAFKYRARSADKWDKMANQSGGGFEGVIRDDYKIFTPKKGGNAVRILPPTWEDPDHYGLPIFIHYSVGPTKASVICLKQTKGQKCPLCEARERALKLGDEDEARELRASKRTVVWMIDRNDEDQGPMIWNMGYSLDKEFCLQAKDQQSGEILPLDHPVDGYDIYFSKDGEGLKTEYNGVKLARRPSEVSEDVLEYIEQRPLPNALLWRTYDECKKLYEGDTGEDPQPAVAPRGNPPRRGGAEEVVPIRRRSNGTSTERPARAVEPAEQEDLPLPQEAGRRRPASAESVLPRDLRDSINDEVPFDGPTRRVDLGDSEPPQTSTADRLRDRYRNRGGE